MHLGTQIFLLSAGVLAYEVVLLRMFSLALWHHFAAMIISVALLGFGLSGTLLALGYRPRFGRCALGFVLTAPVCGWLATHVPFNPLLILWQPREWFALAAIYLLLVVPFTCGALAIGMALLRGPVGRVYAANLVGAGVGALAGIALGYVPLPVELTEYKALPKTLELHGARITSTTHHPLGRVDVVECPALRAAAGLSVAFTGTVPVLPVVFVDGEGGSAVAQAGPYLEWLPSAAPYQFGRRTNVLIIGVGGGTEWHQARQFGAPHVTGVELHPHLAAWTGSVVADGRAFLRRSRDQYDVIQISLLDSLAATAAGAGAANENYLYTVEALREMLARLSDDGVICITRWVRVPPRDEIRLANIVAAAGGQQIFVRGWATGTFLVKRTPFRADELAGLRQWATDCAFQVEDAPVGQESFFDVRPVTDDRPYFSHFFRWRSAPVFLRALGRQSVTVAEWGYVIAVATLAQAVVASVGLLLLPRTGRRGAVLVYFGCLGLGFMFVEIALLKKFVLILGHPLYAVAAVLATMLIVAGLGALRPLRDVRWAAAVIVGLALAATWSWPAAVQFGLLVGLAYFMGMLFPAGLQRVGPAELPWAWAVNGCFSLIGATLASVLAMDAGLRVVLVAGAVVYAVAGLSFRRLQT